MRPIYTSSPQHKSPNLLFRHTYFESQFQDPPYATAFSSAFSSTDQYVRRGRWSCFRGGAAAQPLEEPMDLMSAVQLVLRKSMAHGGLSRGLHEGAKIIEKHSAQLCVLAEDCDQTDYVKLVKGLCADHGIGLLTVPSAKILGEWVGLCKIDSEGKARKVVGCSCVVVLDYDEESEGLNVVQQHIKSH